MVFKKITLLMYTTTTFALSICSLAIHIFQNFGGHTCKVSPKTCLHNLTADNSVNFHSSSGLTDLK